MIDDDSGERQRGCVKRPDSTLCKHSRRVLEAAALPLDRPGRINLVSNSLLVSVPQENEHLQKFQVTWELHNKHLFENLVFSEPILHSSLPALVAQLR